MCCVQGLLIIRSAGSHTTASTTTFMMFFILQDPARWNRLVAEIRGAIKSFDEITNTSISALPYLDAVLFECIVLFVKIC